jgi:Delta7-sterol 5-desaturase
MMTAAEIAILLLVAALGHAMALLWYLAVKRHWRIAAHTIYDLPIPAEQIRRELRNSLHTPIHAIMLLVFLWLGFFQNRSIISFVYSALLATIWAEIWHYASHRAFHLRALHWIHAEHHRSRLNSWLTAISFSFTEKLIFDAGMLLPLSAGDYLLDLNFYGIAAWYIGYLVINSFSHANFEFKSKNYNKWIGRILTSTTYHSLHHSRYTGNYGLGTRFLDRIFATEWQDYEEVFTRISAEQKPLTKLRETVDAPVAQN